MRRYVLLGIVLVGVLAIGLVPRTRASSEAEVQTAVVQLTDKTLVHGVILKGDYMFEHSMIREARGEPCTYIYEYSNGKQGKLVTSFHCTEVERSLSKTFITTMVLVPPDLYQIVEFQFAGSAVGHRVPES